VSHLFQRISVAGKNPWREEIILVIEPGG